MSRESGNLGIQRSGVPGIPGFREVGMSDPMLADLSVSSTTRYEPVSIQFLPLIQSSHTDLMRQKPSLNSCLPGTPEPRNPGTPEPQKYPQELARNATCPPDRTANHSK